MVKEIDSETVIATTIQHDATKPSIKRWFIHSCYLKSAKSFFSATETQAIAQAITQAEVGHRGEIQVIIEASLPSHLAYELDCQQRAEQLFAEYRVWDTEYNSGILIYLNLCAHAVEIVADRGIHQAVAQDFWQNVCVTMLAQFKQQQFSQGLCQAIDTLGEQLKYFYQHEHVNDDKNELSNMPRFL